MNKPLFLPLSAWINRSHPLPERFYNESHVDLPTAEWATWVALEEVSLIHNADSLRWQGFEESKKVTDEYLSQCDRIISGLSGGWLDSEEREMILSEVGEPPIPCLPIYIITVGKADLERVVYIGKTKSEKRFSGGHSVALKLHHPQYNNLEKKIYRCSVWFHFNEEYIALEWIKSGQIALNVLDSIESKLIFALQPDLNVHKKKKSLGKWDFYIHIQNMTGNQFLNDKFI